mmetsp:Transcript_33778/g.97080  ORF Transcript_33778/g.97080 Transcript_33778/m.97080 type:complete len:88 (-) Transcript_33778:1359-1622(-)
MNRTCIQMYTISVDMAHAIPTGEGKCSLHFHKTVNMSSGGHAPCGLKLYMPIEWCNRNGKEGHHHHPSLLPRSIWRATEVCINVTQS